MDQYILGLGEDGFDLFYMIFMGIWQAGFAFGGLLFAGIGLLILLDFFSWRTSKHKYVTHGDIIGVRVGGMKKKDDDIAEDETEIDARLQKIAEEYAEKRKSGGGKISGFFGNIIGVVMVLLIFAVPVTFIGFGAYQMIDYYKVQDVGFRTKGTVVDHKRYSSTNSQSTYAAIFAYTDDKGRQWRAPDRVSSSKLKLQSGTQKTLIYDPRNPQHFYVDDYWYNMTTPTLFMGIGMIVLFFLTGGGGRIAERFSRSKQYTSAPQKKRNTQDYAGEMYYEAIEYITKDGTRIRTTTDSGSSSLLSKVPGTRVSIIADTRDPHKIRRQGMLWFWLALLIFIAPGAGFLFLAFHKGISPVFLLVFAVLALKKGGFIFKIWREYKALSPEEKDAKKDQFAIRRAERKDAHEQKPLLDKYDVRDRIRVYQAQCRISGLLTFMLASGLLIAGYYNYPEFFTMLFTTPQDILQIDLGKLKEKQTMALILSCIGALFMLLSLHSFKTSGKRFS